MRYSVLCRLISYHTTQYRVLVCCLVSYHSGVISYHLSSRPLLCGHVWCGCGVSCRIVLCHVKCGVSSRLLSPYRMRRDTRYCTALHMVMVTPNYRAVALRCDVVRYAIVVSSHRAAAMCLSHLFSSHVMPSVSHVAVKCGVVSSHVMSCGRSSRRMGRAAVSCPVLSYPILSCLVLSLSLSLSCLVSSRLISLNVPLAHWLWWWWWVQHIPSLHPCIPCAW